jgi:hypothetical protein
VTRVKRLYGDGGHASVEITIRVKGHSLASSELTQLVDSLADEAMKAMAQVKYLWVPLSKIKVRS